MLALLERDSTGGACSGRTGRRKTTGFPRGGYTSKVWARWVQTVQLGSPSRRRRLWLFVLLVVAVLMDELASSSNEDRWDRVESQRKETAEGH